MNDDIISKMKLDELNDMEVLTDIDHTEEAESFSLEQRIAREKKEVEIVYEPLFDIVDKRYDEYIKSPELNASFKAHYRTVVHYAIERGRQDGLSEEDQGALVVAAILHDLTKGDPPPDEAKNIAWYTAVTHGQTGVIEARKALSGTTNQEVQSIFENILGDSYTLEDRNRVIDKVANAIINHMGPNPGFMGAKREEVRAEIEARGLKYLLPLVVHPYPNDRISEILLAADMRSLAGDDGINKVLMIRYVQKEPRKEDIDAAKESRRKGPGEVFDTAEVAFMSAIGSAEAAMAMIANEGDRHWVAEVFYKAIKKDYYYLGRTKPLNYYDVMNLEERADAQMTNQDYIKGGLIDHRVEVKLRKIYGPNYDEMLVGAGMEDVF